jgi:prepilin-type N-terminal cleavage/methylation domain-containing protein
MSKSRSLSRRRSAFTIIELLVVIAIIGVLVAMLLPSLEKAREQAITVKCSSNLKQIGLALSLYSNDNHGQFPRTIYVPDSPVSFGTNAAAPNPFAPGGPVPNDVTAALFLLIRSQNIPTIIFNEPYTDEVQDTPDSATDLSARSNFTDYKNNLGYSYANPYPGKAAADAGYQLSNHLNPAFAVAADLNPGVAGKNSRNHEERGQNVLFADIHVEFTRDRYCGVSGDDIYTNKAGAVEASPVDALDSVLLPTDK